MPKLPGVPHLAAIRALQKAGFRIVRQGKHVVMSDGRRILTVPRPLPGPGSSKVTKCDLRVPACPPACRLPFLI